MTAYLWGHVDPLAVNVFALAAVLGFFVYVCVHVVDREYRLYRKAQRGGDMDAEALERLWQDIMAAHDEPFEEGNA